MDTIYKIISYTKIDVVCQYRFGNTRRACGSPQIFILRASFSGWLRPNQLVKYPGGQGGGRSQTGGG